MPRPPRPRGSLHYDKPAMTLDRVPARRTITKQGLVAPRRERLTPPSLRNRVRTHRGPPVAQRCPERLRDVSVRLH